MLLTFSRLQNAEFLKLVTDVRANMSPIVAAMASVDVLTTAFRLRVLKIMLQSGVPLAKIDRFRDILEEKGRSLVCSSRLADLVPTLLANEKGILKDLLREKEFSIAFDGTTKVSGSRRRVYRGTWVGPTWQRLSREIEIPQKVEEDAERPRQEYPHKPST